MAISMSSSASLRSRTVNGLVGMLGVSVASRKRSKTPSGVGLHSYIRVTLYYPLPTDLYVPVMVLGFVLEIAPGPDVATFIATFA